MAQLALGLLLAVAVAGNARRLLKDLTSVGALDRQDGVHLALTDDGVALPAKTGVHEQFVHVLQAAGGLIDEIFALAGTVVAPGHHDLGLRPVKDMVGVIQDQRDLGIAHLLALQSAAEDHVLHFAAPERLGGLLTHDPQDCVRNIRFSASIRADDGCDRLAEGKHGLIREGFEPLDL